MVFLHHGLSLRNVVKSTGCPALNRVSRERNAIVMCAWGSLGMEVDFHGIGRWIPCRYTWMPLSVLQNLPTTPFAIVAGMDRGVVANQANKFR